MIDSSKVSLPLAQGEGGVGAVNFGAREGLEISPYAENPSVLDCLPRAFYSRPTLEVARDLLGKRLVRLYQGQRLAGYITEAEAYIGEDDLACHARAGLTPRTRIMYGPPGHAYVYFTYGLHWMLNFVTQGEGFPAAVLIRAMFPVEGIREMASRRRGQARSSWADGPAKLCQALAIDGACNGLDICQLHSPIFVTPGLAVPAESVTTGPRVGLNSVPEPWKSLPWRFRVVGVTALLREAYIKK